jgi:hypothetical protein
VSFPLCFVHHSSACIFLLPLVCQSPTHPLTYHVIIPILFMSCTRHNRMYIQCNKGRHGTLQYMVNVCYCKPYARQGDCGMGHLQCKASLFKYEINGIGR